MTKTPGRLSSRVALVALALAAALPGKLAVAQCVADLNGDSKIDGADLGLLLLGWGTCGNPCPADLDANGVVDGADLGTLLSVWGLCLSQWATVIEFSPDPAVV